MLCFSADNVYKILILMLLKNNIIYFFYGVKHVIHIFVLLHLTKQNKISTLAIHQLSSAIKIIIGLLTLA